MIELIHDRYWFSFLEKPGGGCDYTIHDLDADAEHGHAASPEAAIEAFDAFVKRKAH